MTIDIISRSRVLRISLVLLCVVACATSNCHAQAGNSTPVKVVANYNPAGAEDADSFNRTYFLPVKFRPIATEVPGLGKTQINLDGKWRIAPKFAEGFQTQPIVGPAWSDFTVPGQWLQQGFDISQNETVGVARTFNVPGAWKGKRIILRFDAVHGGTNYWLNGQHLGYSENLFTPIEFDITDAAMPGRQNRLMLAIKVNTASEGASQSINFVSHNLGGIDRSVRVFALPMVHISRFHYTTPLDEKYTDATLSMDVSIDNPGEAAVSDLALRVKLTDPKGKQVRLKESEFSLAAVKKGENRFSIAVPVSNPLKWSAEKPHLYKLTVELCRAGKLAERLEQTVGFRQIEVKDKQVYLNGKLIKLVGMGRLEMHPLKGRADVKVFAEEDARRLKEANFNYVRTCIHPPTREFLEACDRLGLYVECEAPFCWSVGADDPKIVKHFLRPTAAMVEYHRGHPSVIIWSLQNETAPVHNFFETSKLVFREDTSRLLISNGGMEAECHLLAWHYPPFPVPSRADAGLRPTLLDEYLPPMGGAWFSQEYDLNPGLDTTWSEGHNSPNSHVSQIYASKHVVGGAIFCLADDTFFFADKSCKGCGYWGFIDAWRRKKSLMWDAKLMHSPVWIPIRRLEYTPGQKTATIPVENRYSFTDLSEVKCTWELEGKAGSITLNLPPQTKGLIKVPVPGKDCSGKMLVLRFTDAKGELITAHGVKLTAADKVSDESAKKYIPPVPKGGCPKWTDDGKVIAIQGENFRMEVVKSSGRIKQDKSKLSVPLLELPSPFFARADIMNMLSPQRPNGIPYVEYPDTATRKIESITAEKRGDALAIKVQESYKNFKGFSEIFIDKTGLVVVSFEYTYSGKLFIASETGLRFLFDKKCQEIRWRRDSEWDVYPEDNIGRPEGHADAHMDKKWGKVEFPPYLKKPAWPWSQDENQFGTRDFRSSKYHIYEAELVAPDGCGMRVNSNGTTADVRACLAKDGVAFHVLRGFKPARNFGGIYCLRNFRRIIPGYKLTGSFSIQLLGASPAR